MRLLVFVRHYLPGFQSGGPVRTIANMAGRLGDEIEISIVTMDRDALDKKPYPNIDTGSWQFVGKARVLYLGPGRQRGVPALAKLLRETEYDVLYLNSYFDVLFSLKPLLLRYFRVAPLTPCVIAPRGEFSEGALALKARKKRVYIMLSRLLGLHKGLIWQASSEFEEQDIKHTLGEQVGLVRVAPNLPTMNPDEDIGHIEERVTGSALRVCFLSRISPKKNLEFAIKVLMRVRTKVEFNIYGPVRDEGYWTRCRRLMEALPESITVKYQGSLQPEQVARILAQHDLFFLPTHGENYGHVIAESLYCGTPVLVSNTTPWRNLERDGVGWDLALDATESFARCIDHCSTLEAEEYAAWREHVRAYAAKRLSGTEAIDANIRLFTEAAAVQDG